MNAVIGAIFVTIVHLTNGYNAYSGLNLQSPDLCLNAASATNTRFQLYGWRSDPVTQRAAIIIRQQWKTDIAFVEFTCMTKPDYYKLREMQDIKYWQPIEE